MRVDRDIEYRCNQCNKNLTDRKHIRIFLGFTSGWMVPPFFGGKAAASICDRNPEYHFCKAECFTLYFNAKLHEINPDSTGNAGRTNGASHLRDVLEKTRAERPRVSGTTYMGTRDIARREEGERAVGDHQDMRMGTRGGSVSGRGRHGQEHQPMDSTQSHHGLGSGRTKVSTHQLEARSQVLQWMLWPFATARKALVTVLP